MLEGILSLSLDDLDSLQNFSEVLWKGFRRCCEGFCDIAISATIYDPIVCVL